jgi:arylsulfatase A-like enzyme
MDKLPLNLFLFGFLPIAISAQVSASKPNIVLILADDMGFSDLGSYGSEIHTPNLDALAQGGLRFSQFHNTPRCCPTRASLLTGLYPHSAGLAHNDNPLNWNGATLAEHLRGAGYQTAMVGKWHLSEGPTYPNQLDWVSHRAEHPTFSDTLTYPCKRGFEEHYGTIWGVINYFDPFSLVHNTQSIPTVSADYYHTDALNDKAVEYLDKMGKNPRPFFLYLAHNAPHWPIQARPEDIKKYEGTYSIGWDSVRANRYRNQVSMGFFPENNATLSKMIQDSPWDKNLNKVSDAHNMAVHAAMIDRMDQGLGRVISKLKELGQFENTLIIFLSDNGASPELPAGPGFDRPDANRDGAIIKYGNRNITGGKDVWAGIGPMWANAANTPFRYWKKETFEGGISTPFIVHWPAGLKTVPGTITNQLGQVMDVLPTCLAVAGINYSGTYLGHKLLPLEGKSLLPIFQGDKTWPERSLFWEHEGGKAVRIGDWKLVAETSKPWELYNLSLDRTEMLNLAESNSAKVTEMQNKYTDWFSRVTQVIPEKIALLTPNGGEMWPAGSIQNIRWLTTNSITIQNVKLEYNPGDGWKSIISTTPQIGEYAWRVPAELSPSVKIRVVSRENVLADTSDFSFSITSSTSIVKKREFDSNFKRSPHFMYRNGKKVILNDVQGKILMAW